MHKRIGAYVRDHHLGLVAIFIALSGTAWAAQQVGPGQIKDDAVRSRHIKDGQVRSSDVGNGQVMTADVRNQTLQGADVRDGSLDSADVKDESLLGGDIADGSLGGPEVNDGSLTGGDVAGNSLTGSEILESSLGEVPAVADGAITASKLGAITRQTTSVNVDGGTAGNGSVNSAKATAMCPAGQFAVGMDAFWLGANEDAELYVQELYYETDANRLVGATGFGASDEANDRTFIVAVHCLAP